MSQLSRTWQASDGCNVFSWQIIVTIPLLLFPNITDSPVPPCLFREQCSWAWTSSRAEGRGPSGWRHRCRSSVRSQESPRGQVQPHPGLNPSQLPLPTSTHLWTRLIFIYFFKQGTPAHLSVPQESYLMSNRHQFPPHPQVHCFDTSFLKTVLYCFYCLFVLTEALYVFLCRQRLPLPPVMHWMCLTGYKDHISHIRYW